MGTRGVDLLVANVPSITALLDNIAAQPSKRSRDGESRRVADLVLGVVRSAFNWHAARDDEFVSEAERDEFVLAALHPKETRIYEGDHRLSDEATVDRTRWLLRRLTNL